MIRGHITEDFVPLIPMTLRIQEERFEFAATLDTGFDDCLCLPRTVIDALGLPYIFEADITLADGSQIRTAYFQATMVWDQKEFEIPVLAAENAPLLGMLGLHGYKVCLVARPGEVITIQSI